MNVLLLQLLPLCSNVCLQQLANIKTLPRSKKNIYPGLPVRNRVDFSPVRQSHAYSHCYRIQVLKSIYSSQKWHLRTSLTLFLINKKFYLRSDYSNWKSCQGSFSVWATFCRALKISCCIVIINPRKHVIRYESFVGMGIKYRWRFLLWQREISFLAWKALAYSRSTGLPTQQRTHNSECES